MFKYLLLIAIIAGIWWHWRKPARPDSLAGRRDLPVEQMVACATCGVHLPLGEALVGDGKHYCCEAHRPGKNHPG